MSKPFRVGDRVIITRLNREWHLAEEAIVSAVTDSGEFMVDALEVKFDPNGRMMWEPEVIPCKAEHWTANAAAKLGKARRQRRVALKIDQLVRRERWLSVGVDELIQLEGILDSIENDILKRQAGHGD